MPPARRAAQSQQQQQQSPVLPSGRQEGSRWIGNPPTGEEVAKWFTDNVKLAHDALEHEDYIGGLVLIPNAEKIKRVNAQGNIFEQQRLVHTPYVKVETRVAYWWDWIRVAFDDKDVIGTLVPVPPRRSPDHLPPGFFSYNPTDTDGKIVPYIGCSMQARVVERSLRTGAEGKALFEAPPATKLIAVLGRYGPDPFATMKAETGAIGRALGMAGMLVIPGSGVATAEDMQEIATAQGAAAGAEEVALAAEDGGTAVADDADIRGKIAELAARLESESPEKFAEFEAWAKERKLPAIGELKEHQLRGTLRQLERRVAELGE